ncbi:hypothetical protein OYC64_016031 [Pagothenia borchgrevinki]|uniref:C-type lectin domain-containing protein n=1 Tax=Pagothenia borchgrevinki TaxID=8213 RepID=A0ABD2HHZ3_PAGBO
MLTKGCSTILILNLIFNLVLIEQTSQHQRMFIHVPLRMNWSSAQEYCREHYTDLATIRDEKDIDAIQSISYPCHWNNHCWIGLLRDTTNQDEWNWSDGDESTFIRRFEYHDPNVNHDCGALSTYMLIDDFCNEQHSFVCHDDDLILVKENKTWEDALEHCRNLDIDPSVSDTYLNHVYDLAHMDFGGENSLARRKVQDSETAEVWIGLRFLAGRWLWVNGTPLQKQLNACPEPKRRCGTMSKTGVMHPLMDCLERRNFFCSKKVTV